MKKYQFALSMYDFLDKVTSIFRKYMIGVLLVIVFSTFFFIFQNLIFGIKDFYGFKNIVIVTMIIEFVIYYALSISLTIITKRIKKKNSDLFINSRKDIEHFVNMKKDGYDKELIRNEIKTIVQNHKSDDNKLTDEFLQYSMTSRFKDKVSEYLKYCDMESHYDVNVEQ